MENVRTIFTNFGRVPCGKKTVDVVKIENKTNKAKLLMVKSKINDSEDVVENLHVHPVQSIVQPKQTARIALSYTPKVEDLTENFYYDVFLDSEEWIARLNIHAESVGPCLSPLTFNLKFFHLRDIIQNVKNIEITNKGDCEAKFYFDVDEDNKEFEISQRSGTINGKHKIGLKLSFNPSEPGVYYKKIFCLFQYHKPIVINLLGVYQPKLKVEPKNFNFVYPPELYSSTGYEAYTMRGKVERLPEGDKMQFFQKRFDEEKKAWDAIQSGCPEEQSSEQQVEKKHWTDIISTEVFLTVTYVDVKNSHKVPNVTALVNISENQIYYYSWNNDSCNHFNVEPCQGFLDPKTKTQFTVYLTPSVMDSLFHVELDVKILPCFEPKTSVVYLPLTITLRIIGNSFLGDNCHWLAQSRITPQTLRLPSCVPNEKVYGTFMIERQGHLPFTFEVICPKEPNFIVQPTLGYLSKSFQLFVVEFSSESKETGIYEENLKIKFNDSETNIERIKIYCTVEKPTVCFGSCNSFTFATIFPGSKLLEKVHIENPTNLHLRYEFKVPEDITWTEILNPIGLIEAKSCSEVEIIFKPETPCEYLDYIPCYISSTSKLDCNETLNLQLIGSCQFGYLVATPSYYNLGEISYKESKTFKTVLYNFSSVLLTFRLTPHESFGDAKRDIRIIPDRGCVPPKGFMEVEVRVTTHEQDFFEYVINCQNFENCSIEAQPCEEPRPILWLQFEGVLPTFQITDICFHNGGPLFSPDWAWKMFCVDKINAALKNVHPEDEIQVLLPEGTEDFGPLSIYILMQATTVGEISCESKLNVICSCRLNPKSLENSNSGSSVCVHKKAVALKQFEQKSDVHKRLVLQLKLNYSQQCDLKIELILSFPSNRTLKITAPFLSSSESDLENVSFYTTSDFHLKPVFIGDVHPPVQLFWLYNNTNMGASYCLDMVALQKSTTVRGVFDCINPTGVVPPFSSIPLGFLFRPNEIISYSANAFLHIFEEKTKIITLKGEGTTKASPTTQFAITKTIPKKARLEVEDIPLECYETTINIPFLHVFSQSKRHFYIKNRSKTIKWAFRWHCFNVENVFSATVEPEEGVIEPAHDVFMTLTLQSFSYQTFLSFSVPCDITNYSELKAYEKSIKLRNKLMDNTLDSFTITEKGISYETPDIPVFKKPEPCHIFIAVNANIVTSLNIDQNLTQNQQSIMKAQNEIQNNMCLDFHITPGVLPLIQEILEKIFWHILCSNSIENSLKILQTTHNYNYSNLLSESMTKTQESFKRLMALPDKNLIQDVLATQITDVLCKNFIPDLKNE